MERDGKIRFRVSSIKAIREHSARALDNFFGGLSDENHGSGPFVLERSDHTSGTDQAGNVSVVRAAMHGGLVLAGLVLHDGRARIANTGILFDRQSVHVGADENGWSGPI